MYNNIITISSNKKKEGRAHALKSILSFSQDLVDFQDKVSSKLEEQLDGPYLELVQELEDTLICMNKKLLDIAASQMKSTNRNEIVLDDDISGDDLIEDESQDEMVVTKDRANSESNLDYVFSPKTPSKPFSIK